MRYIALIVLMLALAACGSSAGSPAAGSPSGLPSGMADESPVYQQDVQTCNEFGAFLMDETGGNAVPVYDDANGGNGVTSIAPAVSPALQTLVNKWWDNYEVAEGIPPGVGFATNQSPSKASHLATVYTNAIIVWCGAHAGVNLAAIPMPSGYP